jgi:Pericentrin-AKAP-450 domain of centrosomal targeting protein
VSGGAYWCSNKANLLLLQQMGIYPEPEVRNRRPKMRSVALFVLAMTRMRYNSFGMGTDGRRLKNDWAEHQKAGKELKDGMKRMKHGDRKWVVV